MGVRAQLVAGRETGYAPFSRTADFESAFRRGKRLMCDGCKHGMHSICESEDCPCVCNDSDFRFVCRTDAEPDHHLARVLRIRPELEPLFH